jgi:hypothetical protein
MEVLKDAKPANHIFYIRTKFRNQLVNFFKKTGIETLIHYPIIPPLQKVYKKLYFRQKDNFKNGKKVGKLKLSYSNNKGKINLKADCETDTVYYEKEVLVEVPVDCPKQSWFDQIILEAKWWILAIIAILILVIFKRNG